MSQAASQYAAFWRDVRKGLRVWTVRDAQGFPAPKNRDGQPVMPFWSTLSRVQRIIKAVPAYSQFEPHELGWVEFRDEWLPDLEESGLLVGVNWSGPRAVGYEISPQDIRRAAEAVFEDAGGSLPKEP